MIIIEKCSKNNKNWITFAKFMILPDAIFIPEEEYFLGKYSLIQQGYKYWKIEKEEKEK
jgi:hypothetical protein